MTLNRSHIDSQTLALLRQRLLDEKKRLQRLANESDGTNDAVGAVEPMNNEPTDFADQGMELTTEDTVMALEENDLQLLQQVERALQRLADGNYGLSEVSGKPIPLERLDALPWATTNVDDPSR